LIFIDGKLQPAERKHYLGESKLIKLYIHLTKFNVRLYYDYIFTANWESYFLDLE